MGSACVTTQTHIFFESPYFLPISDETKPKPVNHSIKHDLKPKYNDIDCDCSKKPQTEDKASQTCLSLSNLNEEHIQQQRNFASKNKKRQMKHKSQGMRQKFENMNYHSNSGGQSTTFNCRDISLSQQLKGNKVREKYVIMINSQEEKQRNKSSTLQFSELFQN